MHKYDKKTVISIGLLLYVSTFIYIYQYDYQTCENSSFISDQKYLIIGLSHLLICCGNIVKNIVNSNQIFESPCVFCIFINLIAGITNIIHYFETPVYNYDGKYCFFKYRYPEWISGIYLIMESLNEIYRNRKYSAFTPWFQVISIFFGIIDFNYGYYMKYTSMLFCFLMIFNDPRIWFSDLNVLVTDSIIITVKSIYSILYVSMASIWILYGLCYFLLDFSVINSTQADTYFMLFDLVSKFIFVIIFSSLESCKINFENFVKTKTEQITKENEKVNHLIRYISHEIRGPINAILNISELSYNDIENELKTISSELKNKPEFLLKNYQNDLQSILYQVDIITYVLNDILNVMKINNGTFSINEDYHDVKNMILQLQKHYSISSKEFNLFIDVDIDDLPLLYIDIVRIRGILINFLTNSIKYAGNNKKIIIFCKKCDSSIINKHENKYSLNQNYDKDFKMQSFNKDNHINVLLGVSDNGRGIPSSKFHQLGVPFETLKSYSNGYKESSGLGLFISNKIVNQMNSDIKVFSHPNVCTEFSFVLNCKISNDKNKSSINYCEPIFEEKSLSDKKLKNVLIVDDTLIIHKILTRMLSNYQNIRITSMFDGYNACKALENQKFDLIFMDNLMENMSGCEATSYIRNVLKNYTPIIGFTGNVLENDKLKFLDSGANDILVKPAKYIEIMNILKKYNVII